MEKELIEDLIAEQKINSLIFDFHRFLERRDWPGIEAMIINFTVKEKLLSLFKESNTALRFVASESKVSFFSKSEAEYESILLNVCGSDRPLVRVYPCEKVRLKLNDQSEWKISSYNTSVDAKMLGITEQKDGQSGIIKANRSLLGRIWAALESASS